MLPASATVAVLMGVGEYSKELPGIFKGEEPYAHHAGIFQFPAAHLEMLIHPKLP